VGNFHRVTKLSVWWPSSLWTHSLSLHGNFRCSVSISWQIWLVLDHDFSHVLVSFVSRLGSLESLLLFSREGRCHLIIFGLVGHTHLALMSGNLDAFAIKSHAMHQRHTFIAVFEIAAETTEWNILLVDLIKLHLPIPIFNI
jgi:hypothetical protein